MLSKFYSIGPPLLGNIVTIVCCSWLAAFGLPSVPPKYARRLLLRQMYHLVVADLLSSFCGVVLLLWKLPSVQQTSHGCACMKSWVDSETGLSCADYCCNFGVRADGDWCLTSPDTSCEAEGAEGWGYCADWNSDAVGCIILFMFDLVQELGVVASLLVEVHIALDLVANVFRQSRFHVCLTRSLRWLWVVALAAAVTDHFATPLVYNAGVCHRMERPFFRDTDTELPVLDVLAVVGIAAVLCIYLGLAMAPCVSMAPCVPRAVLLPASVERRHWKRATLYCLATLFAWGPYVVGCCLGWPKAISWPDIGSIRQTITCTAVSLNGAMNVWIYACQTRYVRLLPETDEMEQPPVQQDGAGNECDTSHHVGFGDTEITVFRVGRA